jgi:hypothetical protein
MREDAGTRAKRRAESMYRIAMVREPLGGSRCSLRAGDAGSLFRREVEVVVRLGKGRGGIETKFGGIRLVDCIRCIRCIRGYSTPAMTPPYRPCPPLP